MDTPYTTDTSPEAAAVQLACLQRMTSRENMLGLEGSRKRDRFIKAAAESVGVGDLYEKFVAATIVNQ